MASRSRFSVVSQRASMNETARNTTTASRIRGNRRTSAGTLPLAGLLEVLAAVEREEAADRRLLVVEAVGELPRVVGGEAGEVLEAALGVVGQRVHARDVLLRARDAHRGQALGERPRRADRRHRE